MSTRERIRQPAATVTVETTEDLLSLTEMAVCTGMPCGWIEELVAWDLLAPVRVNEALWFDAAVLSRVRMIVRLHRQVGVSLDTMALVLELLDRIAELENEIASLRG
ncbi:MAG: chaperone modulator CbpM [bacterium]